MSWRSATFCIVSMTSWLWSAAMFVVEKIGAISNWAGATSLCLVLEVMPIFQSWMSRSFMNEATRSLIAPKYWSSSSCPLGGAAPKSVRPQAIRSSRSR